MLGIRVTFPFLHAARSGLLLDSEHTDALEKIRYLESKHQRTAEEEMATAEAPVFGHNLRSLKLEESQSAHFETTLTPVNDATMKVYDRIQNPIILHVRNLNMSRSHV